MRPKATARRKSNLVTLTRPNREKLSQPGRVNVGPYPPATQRNWLTTLKAKETEAAASSQTPTPTQPVEVPATESPTPSTSPNMKYCAICTPLGKICPNEYPMSLDWDEDLEKQERKNQEIEDQKDNDRKTPQMRPKSSSIDTFTPQPPNPPLNSSIKGPVRHL